MSAAAGDICKAADVCSGVGKGLSEEGEEAGVCSKEDKRVLSRTLTHVLMLRRVS